MTLKGLIKQIGKEHWTGGLVLFCAFGIGILFVFLVPPWQHYDEPGQFEYAWLVANRPKLPEFGDYDQAMRRELAASMMEHGFFKGLNFTPNLLSVDTPVWIGYSQTNDLPLYYWVVALPLRFVKTSDITFQLYLGRLVSLLFYLVTIIAAYGLIVELTMTGSPLRWIIPLSIALLPSFVDIMTAINNDVGATAFFSLFLWFAVVNLRRGFSLLRFAALVVSALLCWWVKNTVMVAVILVPLVTMLSLVRSRCEWAAVGLTILAIAVGLFYSISEGDAAFWYRDRTQVAPVRMTTTRARFGNFALQQTLLSGAAPARLFQIIPSQTTYRLRGQTVSLGAWIWADQPVKMRSPSVDTGTQTTFSSLEIDTQPTFHVITATLASDTSRLRVVLSPISGVAQEENTVYYNGLVLAEGERPANPPPSFSDSAGSQGSWGDKPFQNLLRNPNGKDGWVRLRPRVESALSKLFPVQVSLIMPSFFDLSGSWVYYRPTAKQLFRTFWATFGWGHVSLYGSKPYRVLGAISLAGLLGSIAFFLRRWRGLPWRVILAMGLAITAIWGATLVRGIDFIFGGTFLPSARYAYPAIIPTMIVFSQGMLELLHFIGRRFHIPPHWLWRGYILFFIGLDLLSIASIYLFYN